MGLRTEDFPSFEAFVPAGNGEALATLRAAVTEGRGGVVYVWGPAGSGKTHLLQAACVAAATAIYLPLARLSPGAPEVLEGLETRGLVSLDSLERVAGDRRWEEALFHLCNRAQEAGAVLVLAGRPPPRGLGIGLPDLESRIAGGLVLGLRTPDEEELLVILGAMARRRGLRVTMDALRYLVSRQRRELGYLGNVLERLDAASLAAQRRVTVPLVKAVLEAPEELGAGGGKLG